MTFPHSEFERSSMNDAARRAIENHGKPGYRLDQETHGEREKEHTGIELTGVELAYLKKMTFGRIEAVQHTVSKLEQSLGEGAAPNSGNTRGELKTLREELNFLQHNLAEKLFKKTEDTDNEVAI